MLKIIEGGFFSAIGDIVKAEILALTNEKRRVYLLVPEQQTVTAEKEMAELLPNSAPLTFEVTNFTRLADTFYRGTGKIAGERCDPSKRALVMWRTLTELSPVLSITARHREINSGLVEKTLSAIKEMESLSVNSDELFSLSENPKLNGDERLTKKLSDLSKIASLYSKLLSEKYSNAKDECERLSELLNTSPRFFENSVFYISGFTSFTEPQYKVLSHLIRYSEVSVLLTLPKAERDFFEFTEISATEKRLLRAADRTGSDKKLIRCEEKRHGTPLILDGLSRLLWKSFGKLNSEYMADCDSLRIFEAQDPYEECDFIAADIKKRVMEGASYKDFAIVARDAGKYNGIIDTSLKKADIPAFISKQKDIYSFEAIKLISSAFSVLDGGFSRHDVISYAKCRLCGVSAEECDEFELYLDRWQLDGEDFTRNKDFTLSPDGYSQRKSAGADAKLVRINLTRARVITPLLKFKAAAADAKTVKEYATALFNFLTDISLEEKIEARRIELIRLGESEAALENERLWGIICQALDSVVEVLSDLEINLSVFENLLRIVLSSVNVGKIPSFIDEVTVGSADMIRLTDKKEVYLIGVNKNEFPRPAQDSSYFTLKERRALSEIGFSAEADEDVSYARELYFFSRAFTSTSDRLTLLYSLRDEAFTQCAKSDVIDRITALTDGKIKPCRIADLKPEEKIYYPDAAFDFSSLSEVKDALCDTGLGEKIKISEGKITNDNMRLQGKVLEAIYKNDLALTQTRIDTFVDCPFAYYLCYNLKLSENERAEFDARNIGTFVHAMLENFLGEIAAEDKDIRLITEEEKNDIIKRSAQKYLDSITEKDTPTSKRTDIMIDRIFRASLPVIDGICDELCGCKFKPRFFELKIGTEDENLPTPAVFTDKDGKRVSVYGSIDRVDTYESGNDVFVRVIDYKTGRKVFSPDDIDEGKNLQMFLYLKALAETENELFLKRAGVKEGGRIIPAGVIYVQTDLSDVTIPHADKESEAQTIRKKQGRRGMVLNDAESLNAMNPDYLPVKFKKDGDIDSRYKKFAYTPDEWSELNERISNKMLEISGRMRSGEISPTKEKGALCEWCKYKSVCRKKLN